MATPVTPKKQGMKRFWFRSPCFSICLRTSQGFLIYLYKNGRGGIKNVNWW